MAFLSSTSLAVFFARIVEKGLQRVSSTRLLSCTCAILKRSSIRKQLPLKTSFAPLSFVCVRFELSLVARRHSINFYLSRPNSMASSTGIASSPKKVVIMNCVLFPILRVCFHRASSEIFGLDPSAKLRIVELNRYFGDAVLLLPLKRGKSDASTISFSSSSSSSSSSSVLINECFYSSFVLRVTRRHR